jgi:hypothetical protein
LPEPTPLPVPSVAPTPTPVRHPKAKSADDKRAASTEAPARRKVRKAKPKRRIFQEL